MMDLFDTLGRSLNFLVDSHENNNVSYAAQGMGYATGGVVGGITKNEGVDPYSDSGTSGSDAAALRQQLAANAKSSASSPDFNIFGGRETNYYNSPEGITQRISSGWGHFFSPQMNSGGTDAAMQKPGKSKPETSSNPDDFYAHWYLKMRQFAQAEEVADRGQSQIKTR